VARPGTPARVVIDEAIEIARKFGSDESGRFVNGVLDRIARALRPGEL
jgi:N utilization substance protein B